MKQSGYWWFVEGVRRLVLWSPHVAAVFLGKSLGHLLWLLDRSHVRAAEDRCLRALKVERKEARRIVRRSYGNLGRGAAEFLRLPRVARNLPEYVRLHGEENLASAYAEGKGVILLTAHFGNWELAAARIAERGYPMNAIGAEQRDERFTDLVARLRHAAGVTTLGKGFDLRRSLECLRKGELLGVLLDQDPRDKGVVVPFLGLPASTPPGPVKIAFRRGARVVPLFIVRRKDGVTHDLHLLPPLEGPDGGPFGDPLEDAVAECNRVISQWICRYPDHWMWLYPRWASTLDAPEREES